MTTVPVEHQRTGWVGWVVFDSVMMGILATFHAIAGLVAIFKDDFYLVGSSGLVLEIDYSAWGWIHLGLAVLVGGAALSLLSGNMYGRVVGIAVAALSAIANLAFISAYPVWSVVMIAIDVLVIFAITVHGRELQA